MLTTIMAALLLTAAPASQQADTTFPVDPHGRLQIERIRGDVSIHTWDRPQMRVGTDEEDRGRLRIDAGSSIVRVGFDPWGGSAGGDLELTIPATMAIRVTGPTGDVHIEGSQGEVTVETASGGITLRGGRGQVSLQTVQGDLSLHDAQGRVELHTASGDVNVANVTGDVTVETINGDITMYDINAPSARVSTVSGDISYSGDIQDRGTYSITAHNGDINLLPQRQMNALINVSTFSGDFETDIPLHLNEQQGGKRFSFTLGTGSAHVQLESFSGDIRIGHDRAPAKEDK